MIRKIMTYVIIAVLVAALVFIGYLTYKIIIDKPVEVENPVEEVKAKPEIVLTPKQTEDGDVIISVTTSIEDEDGIREIVLPNDSKVFSDKAEYKVEENGEYKFRVVANNGEYKSATIEIDEIEERSSKNPYVPEGFSVISDDINEGFVIEDEHGNQYVWVPVENGKPKRDTGFDTNYEENSSTATALVNSVAKYYGFYIGRFEASEYEVNGRKTAASMNGKIPWTNISSIDAVEYANSSADAFGYEDCNTALINSYAWDSTLNWIDTKYENYSSSIDYGNYNDSIINPTGGTSRDVVFQICDLAGNVSEWTTEVYKNNNNNNKQKDSEKNIISKVIRGGSATLSRTPQSRRGYAEDLRDPYWGFRLVLYK